ncbi:hypothetical protein [Paracoccus sp. 22332]|uniref:hypothetical protein n=1 Tax=Paracoccus sp. 22332 TaxID=3453913 RepID=UPI003F8306EE
MRELSSTDLNTVVDAFRVIQLLSETIWQAAAGSDRLNEAAIRQVEEDAAIIADRMNAAIGVLDAQYPGLKELIALSDRRAVKRAEEMFQQQAAQQPRH